MLGFEAEIWAGHVPSSFIVYALDFERLALAPAPVREYERSALFKEKARATVGNGEFLVEIPHKAYEFYHLNEADYKVMASETKPRIVEIRL